MGEKKPPEALLKMMARFQKIGEGDGGGCVGEKKKKKEENKNAGGLTEDDCQV